MPTQMFKILRRGPCAHARWKTKPDRAEITGHQYALTALGFQIAPKRIGIVANVDGHDGVFGRHLGEGIEQARRTDPGSGIRPPPGLFLTPNRPARSNLWPSVDHLELVAQASPPDAGPTVRRLSDYESTPVQWLWRGWMPRGTVTLFDGNPGEAKSTTVMELIARVTTGSAWPDGQPGGEPADVLIITREDDPSRVLRPRLEVSGADLDGGRHRHVGQYETSIRKISTLRSRRARRSIRT